MKNKDHRTFPRIRGTSPTIQASARELRRRSTEAERLLWDHLRNRRLAGLKFRRQHPLGPYIVDFYCAAHRLIVEVDGPIHAYTQEQDTIRSEWLDRYGYRVLRFTNEEVLYSLESVLERIRQACEG